MNEATKALPDEKWDLTAFAWFLEAKGRERLRLRIHVALPAWAEGLRDKLRGRGIRCRAQGCEVRVDEAASIARAARSLAPGSALAEEVGGWAALAGPRAPYVALSAEERRNRRHAVQRVLRLAPAVGIGE